MFKGCVQRFELLKVLELLELLVIEMLELLVIKVLVIEVLVMLDDQGA